MYISGAIIKNFRCFKNLELSFETLNILIGENGCGKTAVLEALNYAFSPSFLASRIDEQDFNFNTNESIEIQVLLPWWKFPRWLLSLWSFQKGIR